MRLTALAVAVCVAAASEVAHDDSALSLLQTRARPIKGGEDSTEDKFDENDEASADEETVPAWKAAQIRARRDARKAAREAGRLNPQTYSPEKLARIRERRAAKRRERRAQKAAGERSIGDGGLCEECTLNCDYLYEEAFKQCMIDNECQPWQKEDGPSSDKCKKRCDRSANWKREPCIRKCECDTSNLIPASLKQTSSKVVAKEDAKEDAEDADAWVNGIHRCRQVEVGTQISTCQEIALDEGSPQYDSIKKCAQAAVDAGADTFNFFRSSKEWGRCSLRSCGGANLQLADAPALDIPPAGHGGWKVFSSYCAAPPPGQQSDTGADPTSR